MVEFEKGELLYENPLAAQNDVKDFITEGDAAITFPRGRMRMENAFDRCDEKHQSGNFNIWCPIDFPDNIAVSWDFRPLTDTGLSMFWIAAKGRNGEDLFDANLASRNGIYKQYFDGDINALHCSYFRRNPKEIGFRVCNLRKSHGFHLVCAGGDPIPDSAYAKEPYRIEVVKAEENFAFSINGLMIYHWIDDGKSYGNILKDGKIGFRQMAGLIAEYANLTVHEIPKK